MRRRNRIPKVLVGPAITIAILGTAACSSPGREYTVPSSICGVKIPQKLMNPMLPAGERVSSHPTSNEWNKRCRIQVDDDAAFSATIEWWESDESLERVAKDAIGVDPQDEKTPDRRFIYSRTGAAGIVDCPVDRSTESVFVSARVTHELESDTDMKKLITAYADAVAKTDKCHG